jgi:glutathione S-transferase
MKLYFRPGACSLSPHIVLRELGLPFDLELVDTKAQKTAGGADYTAINPKKYVPTLQLDDGQVLTEGAVIVQYLADRKPDAMLAPPWGSMDRYRVQEWLNYVASELHKSFGPIFRASEEQRPTLRDALAPKLDFVAGHLGKRQFLLGDRFTVADAYLFTVLRWSDRVGIDLGRWPAIQSYMQRVSGRPAVRAALEAEGLLRNQ